MAQKVMDTSVSTTLKSAFRVAGAGAALGMAVIAPSAIIGAEAAAASTPPGVISIKPGDMCSNKALSALANNVRTLANGYQNDTDYSFSVESPWRAVVSGKTVAISQVQNGGPSEAEWIPSEHAPSEAKFGPVVISISNPDNINAHITGIVAESSGGWNRNQVTKETIKASISGVNCGTMTYKIESDPTWGPDKVWATVGSVVAAIAVLGTTWAVLYDRYSPNAGIG